MNKVALVEKEVRNFTNEELAAFRKWFAEFDARMWDVQLERDIASGKLDFLADEALSSLKTGKCKDI
jgi:hypothetical protein